MRSPPKPQRKDVEEGENRSSPVLWSRQLRLDEGAGPVPRRLDRASSPKRRRKDVGEGPTGENRRCSPVLSSRRPTWRSRQRRLDEGAGPVPRCRTARARRSGGGKMSERGQRGRTEGAPPSLSRRPTWRSPQLRPAEGAGQFRDAGPRELAEAAAERCRRGGQRGRTEGAPPFQRCSRSPKGAHRAGRVFILRLR